MLRRGPVPRCAAPRCRTLFAAASLWLAGCATSGSSGGSPRPVTLSNQDRDAVAALLRLEDRREFDAEALRTYSAWPAPEVRRRTGLALGRLREAAGVPLLQQLLSDPDTAVAASAAFSLGLVGDASAVPALTTVLTPESLGRAPSVAGEAASALGSLRSAAGHAVLSAILAAPRPSPQVSHAVIGPALLAIWKYPRGADFELITRWTGSADPELRWRAAYALVRRPDPAATTVLLDLARDPDPVVRAVALRGLTAPLADSGNVGRDTALRVVLAASQDGAYPVRINAVRSLGSFPDAQSVGALQALVSSPDAHLAWTAIESLGRLGEQAAASAPALRGVAVDPTVPRTLRNAALFALASVAPSEAEAIVARFSGDPDWTARASAASAIAKLGASHRAELGTLARDPDPRVAAAAIAAAVGAGEQNQNLRALLLGSLGSPDVMVRAAGLSGMAGVADPATLPLVLDAYDRAQRDTLNDAALAAVDALGALQRAGAPAARPFFRRFRRSTDPLIRQRVASVFGDAASAAWRSLLPIETGVDSATYRALVDEWVVPTLSGGPAPRARVETEAGSIEVEFFAADAPLTVLNFARLAEEGYFNGQRWPRVVPNFVVQGGDPRGDTSGGPGWAIRDEINRHRYSFGTVGMALSGPDTGGSQFFITHSPQPHLDGGYTVFGRVISGLEIAQQILPGDVIRTVTITR
jgi:cyclophilin family peptidyl-prolyl cis-trans isomerase/HEAT repeat protein